MADIFSYTDYRDYLKAHFEEKKAQARSFSMRNFTRLSGFKSPTYLGRILSGQRNLSAESIPQLIKALNLKKTEAEYFEALVHYHSAKTEDSRHTFLDRIMALRPKMKMTQVTKDQYALFTKRYISVVHQMSLLPDFKEDYKWIAEHVYPSISTKEAKYAVDVLLRLGFFERDQNKKLKNQFSSLYTPSEVTSLEVKYYHLQSLLSAQKALSEIPAEFRDFSAIILPAHHKHINRIKAKLDQFRKDIANLVSDKQKEPYQHVYQLNLQLFPVTWDKKQPPET